jgi:hypothetical protein
MTQKYSEIFKALATLTPTEVLVLKGIISGDGDIGGRMASSHPDAKPPVSRERKRFLEGLANDFIEAQMPLDLLDR